jgi:hypothetical protein
MWKQEKTLASMYENVFFLNLRFLREAWDGKNVKKVKNVEINAPAKIPSFLEVKRVRCLVRLTAEDPCLRWCYSLFP